jgi:hypothetical protein
MTRIESTAQGQGVMDVHDVAVRCTRAPSFTRRLSNAHLPESPDRKASATSRSTACLRWGRDRVPTLRVQTVRHPHPSSPSDAGQICLANLTCPGLFHSVLAAQADTEIHDLKSPLPHRLHQQNPRKSAQACGGI